MRAPPACGKSFRAKELLKEFGDNGFIFSTDEFFYLHVKPEKPDVYSFNPRFLGQAHKWNLVRAQKAIENGVETIIVDNTNTTASEPRPYVEYSVHQGYDVLIEEPTSPWWKEIRDLLVDKRAFKKELKEWAKKLEEKNKDTHSVPAFAIEKMFWRWQNDLTVDQILQAPNI